MRFIWLSLLFVCVCSPQSGIATENLSAYWTTNGADEEACHRQLNFIYGALQEYQRRNHSLPHWLSDLVPDYIHDPNALVCPFVLGTGNLKKWRQKYRLGSVF